MTQHAMEGRVLAVVGAIYLLAWALNRWLGARPKGERQPHRHGR